MLRSDGSNERRYEQVNSESTRRVGEGNFRVVKIWFRLCQAAKIWSHPVWENFVTDLASPPPSSKDLGLC
ncbi:hypothetical protein ACFX19_030843 [Malus domestica]